MAKSKARAEVRDRPAASTTVEKRPEMPGREPEREPRPDRQLSSPVRAAPPPLPPPNGEPAPARAAGILSFDGQGPGAAGRARLMTGMQRTVGNARTGRMLAKTPPPAGPPAEPPIEAPPSAKLTVAPVEPGGGASPPGREAAGSGGGQVGGSLDPQILPPLPSPATQEMGVQQEAFEGAEQPEEVIEREAASAGAEPGVSMEKTEDGARILEPKEPPQRESLEEPQHPSIRPRDSAQTAPPTHREEDTPTPPMQEVVSEPRFQGEMATRAQEALPSETLQALERSPAVDQAGAEPIAQSTGLEEVRDEGGAEELGAQASVPSEAGATPGAAASAQPPPPAPETLRGAIPERQPTLEEFLGDLEAGRTPQQNRDAAQSLLQGLRNDAESEKAALLAEAEVHKAELASFAEAQIEAIEAAVETEATSIRDSFAASRASLAAYADQQKAAVQAQAALDLARVETATATRVAAFQATLEQRKRDLVAFAEEQSRQPTSIAEAEANRADTELESAAQQAEHVGENVASRYPGSEDPAPEQRAAARGVGRESAADIREKKPAIREALTERAQAFSGRYMDYAQAANAQIDGSASDVLAAFESAAAAAANTIQSGSATATQAIDQRLQVDLQALNSGEIQGVVRVQEAGRDAITQIRSGAAQAASDIDAGLAAVAAEIDSTVMEAENVVSAEEQPYLPGIADVVQAARSSLLDTGAAGRTALAEAAAEATQMLLEIAASGTSQMGSVTAAAGASATQVEEQARTAVEDTVEGCREQAQSALAGLADEQDSLMEQALLQIDQGLEQARGEMVAVNEQFQRDAAEATDESLREAKKPLTDPAEDRAEAASEDAGASWWEGLLQAIGELIVGFLILVAVALVVAALTGLTLGGALLVVGAVFLVIGTISAYRSRSEQLAREGIEVGGGFIFLLALSDATGLTGVGEAIHGVDVVTGKQLSAGERTRRGTVGMVTALGVVFGARAAVKGIPGGWTRPTSIFRGWSEFSLVDNVRGLVTEVRDIGVSLYQAARRGVEAVREWVQRRSGRDAEDGSRRGTQDEPPTPEQPVEPESPEPPGEHPVEPGAPRYDPKTRTTEELRVDRDPAPRQGETPEQAAERVRLADEELLQRAMETYEALGDEPREVNIQAEDAAHADAHTIERHGAEVPLRRVDNPGGRTIEGRIYGDPPWPTRSNGSARWLSNSLLRRVVNDYIRANWQAIRSDLAVDGAHTRNFDAGRAIGEGFYNSGAFGQGSINAVYGKTSLVRITILLDPGPPASFYILTAFPNILGTGG